MIMPDINVLVYAYNTDAPHHAAAKRWWEDVLSGRELVGIPWVVCLGFLRLMTNRRVCASPMEPAKALANIRSWLTRPHVQVLEPGPRHMDILDTFAAQQLLSSALCTDAHLAALAIENQAVLWTNDSDFVRFPGLRHRNPLASRSEK
jgi:toxin-antitoxin system PIN domain toxin